MLPILKRLKASQKCTLSIWCKCSFFMWKKIFPGFRYFFKYAKTGIVERYPICTFVFLFSNTDYYDPYNSDITLALLYSGAPRTGALHAKTIRLVCRNQSGIRHRNQLSWHNRYPDTRPVQTAERRLDTPPGGFGPWRLLAWRL